ncbi:hypothetical protein OROMI_015228 [Orobanche minor]
MTPTRGRVRRGGSSTGSSRQTSSSSVEPDVDDLTLLGSDGGSDRAGWEDRIMEECSRKRFLWPPSWEDDVYCMWESRARNYYRDYIHDMKVLRTACDLGRPEYCFEEMWTGLCDYWDSSEATIMNRMSEPGGSGSGISKHRGGSKSGEILTQEMAQVMEIAAERGEDANLSEIYFDIMGRRLDKRK